MPYTRRSGDVAYRKVLLNQNTVPEYTNFTSDGETIQYSAGVVLEILRDDNTERLEYDHNQGQKKTVRYLRNGQKFMILSDMENVSARLWIRDEQGMEYKIPSNLPRETSNFANGCVYFMAPAASGNLTIVGDKYINKAADLCN